jgi:DNA repair and recombination protein RAD52
MIDWEKATVELAKRLDPAHVKKPTGQFGPKGDYLEGWHVINEANRIFGYNGWSYTIELKQDALTEGKDGKGNPQWQAAYTCVCTLRVGDVTRQDVGFGSGFAKMVGDAVEGATKEAATDALKRALRTFGNPVIAKARVERLRVLVKGAQSVAALDAFANGFAPDWPAVVADANARKSELQQKEDA